MDNNEENPRSQNTEMTTVPYIVFEVASAQHERSQKRMVIAIILMIVINFITNAAWLYAMNRYDYKSSTETRIYSQDGQGVNIIGGINGVDGSSVLRDDD